MGASVRLDGLLCTTDEQVLRVLQPALDTFAIATTLCREADSGVLEVRKRRFDAVIVDWNGGDNPPRLLRATRHSSWNSKSTIFAMVENSDTVHGALRAGANFLIHKPADAQCVGRCLRAAYGTILQQRRRSERCSIDAPVVAKFSQLGKIEARVIDISVGGLALQCDQAVDLGLHVSLSFLLPASNILVHVAGKVVNADRHGRAGICFTFVPQEELKLLESWLAVQFAKLENAEIPIGSPDNIH